MNKRIFTGELCGRPLVVETGEMAQFANGSVLLRFGDTVVLATATANAAREGIDFFPLSVDYEEKMYAVGKIPGGFLRREGKPSDKAVLTARLIDRPLRPLFPKDMRTDVTVNNLVLSVDQDNSPEVAAMIASSLAVAISDIAWNGPIAGVQVGLVDDRLIVCPSEAEAAASRLQLTVAGTLNKICMIEAGAAEVPDEQMLEAIALAHTEIKKICTFINTIVEAVGKTKAPYQSYALDSQLMSAVRSFAAERMKTAVQESEKEVLDANVKALASDVQAHITEVNPDWVKYSNEAVDLLEKETVRELLFKEHKRVDGRKLSEIRALSAAIDILPRVHGSGLFQRGQTQVLSIATLGTLSNSQHLDGLDAQTDKRYMHQYNFPGYSVGESKPNRSPGRREIGHGALAERALIPVLPSPEEFPYAIRVVSEVTMSNGSTSQGSVCASTLALMAAGVPIKAPIAGISSGLIINKDDDADYLVFMDIQGIEDFFGDMDFKVAGSKNGITAIQVDIKVEGLSLDIIRDAFALTKAGRLQILNEVIAPVISEPRTELSPFAPKIEQIDIPADKIREVIGSGGKVIRRITEETKAEIDIVEDGPIGHVYIASPNNAAAQAAIQAIKTIVFDPEPGTIFEATVTKLMTFGAFVEFAPGKEGLVHISKMSWDRVENVEDVVEPGQRVKVIVTDIDSQGRINLSMRDLLAKPDGWKEEPRLPRPERRDERRGGEHSRPNSDRPRRSQNDYGDRGRRPAPQDRPPRREPANDKNTRDEEKNIREF